MSWAVVSNQADWRYIFLYKHARLLRQSSTGEALVIHSRSQYHCKIMA